MCVLPFCQIQFDTRDGQITTRCRNPPSKHARKTPKTSRQFSQCAGLIAGSDTPGTWSQSCRYGRALILRQTWPRPASAPDGVFVRDNSGGRCAARPGGKKAQRKILANETEKVAIEINFRVELVEGRRSGFAQIWNAFRESGDVLGESIYWMILATVAILPWSALIAPLIGLTVRVWRRFWGRRTPSVQTVAVTGG